MESRVYEALRLLTDDLSRGVSIEEVARSVNLSSSRFHHLFKAEVGISPARYRKQQRLLLARHLLETTFLSIKEIILRAGFKDRNHFSRDFKKVLGLAPSKYRTQHLVSKQEGSTTSDSRIGHISAGTVPK